MSHAGPRNPSSQLPRWTVPAALALLLLAMVVYSIRFFFTGLIHNVREIYTYNLDTIVILRDVQHSLYAPHFRLDFTDYGQLYYNLAILTSYLYSAIAHPSEGAIFAILGLLSLAGGILTVVASFLFARRFLGAGPALYCAATLVLCPALIVLCTEPHPDTWQAFFVISAVYFCARSLASGEKRALSCLAVSAAAAGAAFSTKYIGLLLLPFLITAALLVPLRPLSAAAFARFVRIAALLAAFLIAPFAIAWHKLTPDYALLLFPNWRLVPPGVFATLIFLMRGLCAAAALACLAAALAYVADVDFTRHRRLIARLLLLAAIPTIFTAAFALTSPWDIWQLRFFPSVYLMGNYVNYGHGVKADWYGWRWFLMLGGPALTPLVALVALSGLAAIVWRWRAARFQTAAVPLILLAGWAVFYITFMVFRINLVKDYYLLPVIPAIAVLGAAGLKFLHEALTLRLGAGRARPITVAVALFCLLVEAAFASPRLPLYRPTSDMAPEKVAMAQWLSRCVAPQARIMTAAYSYIPPSFPEAWLNTDQGGYDRLAYFQPDIVILNREDIAYYEGSLENSSTNVMGTTADKLRYFQTVAHSPQWKAGPSFGLYAIFERAGRQVTRQQTGCS